MFAVSLRRDLTADCLEWGRMANVFVAAFCLSLVGLGAAPVHAGVPSDEYREGLHPTGDVNDFAKILAPTDRSVLADRCRAMQEKTGAALVVVIIDSLMGGDIDDFANKLFQQWGIGQQGKDNGVLLLVALSDRKARLEVGYGLEPIVPDALAGRILEEQLFPAFKQGRYADGLKAAVNRTAEIIERGEPASPEELRGGVANLPLSQQIIFTLFLGVFVAIGSFLAGAGIGARVVILCLMGLFFGGLPFVMAMSVVFPLAPLIHTPIAIALIVTGVRTGRRKPALFRSGRHTGKNLNSWTWGSSGGSSSGSSWSGGGFSSSSGSFGGGRSGGGGASGGW